jgi:hypothetical protein
VPVTCESFAPCPKRIEPARTSIVLPATILYSATPCQKYLKETMPPASCLTCLLFSLFPNGQLQPLLPGELAAVAVPFPCTGVFAVPGVLAAFWVLAGV